MVTIVETRGDADSNYKYRDNVQQREEKIETRDYLARRIKLKKRTDSHPVMLVLSATPLVGFTVCMHKRWLYISE